MSSAHELTGSYIPSTDAGFRDGILNFSTLISADPQRYGLDSSDAAIIARKDATKTSAIRSACAYTRNIKGTRA